VPKFGQVSEDLERKTGPRCTLLGSRDRLLLTPIDMVSILRVKRIYVFDGNSYTGVNGKVGDDGKLALTVPGKALRYRVDYSGQYFVETTHRPEIHIPHRRVVIDSNNGDHNLSGTRVYAFSGNSYTGLSQKVGEDAKATFYPPDSEFRYRVDYAGQVYTETTDSEAINVAYRVVTLDSNNDGFNLAGSSSTISRMGTSV